MFKNQLHGGLDYNSREGRLHHCCNHWLFIDEETKEKAFLDGAELAYTLWAPNPGLTTLCADHPRSSRDFYGSLCWRADASRTRAKSLTSYGSKAYSEIVLSAMCAGLHSLM